MNFFRTVTPSQTCAPRIVYFQFKQNSGTSLKEIISRNAGPVVDNTVSYGRPTHEACNQAVSCILLLLPRHYSVSAGHT